MNLVIGNGLIGKALAKHVAPDVYVTDRSLLDLLDVRNAKCDLDSPFFGPVFMCAGVSGYEACQGSREAYRANVDGTLTVARQVMQAGAFFVFLSTRAIEWGDQSDYTRHKAVVEVVLHAFGPNHAVIRPTCKIDASNVASFVAQLVKIGSKRRAGVHHIP